MVRRFALSKAIVWLNLAAVGLAVLLNTNPGRAAVVAGDTTTGAVFAAGALGTTELFAYSQQTSGRVTTTNASTLGITSVGPLGGPFVVTPIPGFGVLGDGTCILVVAAGPNCAAGPRVYGPPVAGIRGLAKPAVPVPPNNAGQSGSSTTGAFMGLAAFTTPTNRISAGGTGAGTGRAAAAAFDPIAVSPGSYQYQATIDASLQLDGPDDAGGILFFAVDSRTTDLQTFYQMGEPLDQTLWYLSIAEQGPVFSTADLFDPAKFDVTFKINDPALVDATMPNGSAYSDAAIAAALLNAFTVENDTATLSNYLLFPSNVVGAPLPGMTVYNVDSTIEYGNGVNAGLTTVPEPSSLTLLTIAILAAGAVVLRRQLGMSVEVRGRSRRPGVFRQLIRARAPRWTDLCSCWPLVICALLIFAYGDAALALQIQSSGTYRTSFAKGVAVGAAAPGTGCSYVSGGPVGPFGLNSFPATFPPAPGTCPVSAAPIQDGLASAVGFPGLLGSGITSYGGTLPKANNQFVFAERDRFAPATTTLLAKGVGGWDTVGSGVPRILRLGGADAGGRPAVRSGTNGYAPARLPIGGKRRCRATSTI
jgi:hypothetical protein